MLLRYFLLPFYCLLPFCVLAQQPAHTTVEHVDTIYVVGGERIICEVQEYTPDIVRFWRPGNPMPIEMLYVNSIEKVAFGSTGHVWQPPASAAISREQIRPQDYALVVVAEQERQVQGLWRVGLATSKARGASIVSMVERVKRRAFRKLQMQAAMMGGCVVYRFDSRTQGNGGSIRTMLPNEDSYEGMAYSRYRFSASQLLARMGGERVFPVTEKYKFWAGAPKLRLKRPGRHTPHELQVDRVWEQQGLVMLSGTLLQRGRDPKRYTFRLTAYEGDYAYFYYTNRSEATAYSVKVKLH